MSKTGSNPYLEDTETHLGQLQLRRDLTTDYANTGFDRIKPCTNICTPTKSNPYWKKIDSDPYLEDNEPHLGQLQLLRAPTSDQASALFGIFKPNVIFIHPPSLSPTYKKTASNPY